MLLGGHAPAAPYLEVLRTPRSRATLDSSVLFDALHDAGCGPNIDDAARNRISRALEGDDAEPSAIMRAAAIAGAIVAPAASSADALRAGALAASLVLTDAGLSSEPWIAPWQIDAVTRSAAVQVERSGAWGHWSRAWCALLARDAVATERAVRGALTRMATEREKARAERRVGATDDAVLAHLHAQPVLTIRDASTALDLTTPTVGTAIERLEAAGFASELTGQRRDRAWTSSAVLALTLAR
jgi:hypothetical protein